MLRIFRFKRAPTLIIIGALLLASSVATIGATKGAALADFLGDNGLQQTAAPAASAAPTTWYYDGIPQIPSPGSTYRMTIWCQKPNEKAIAGGFSFVGQPGVVYQNKPDDPTNPRAWYLESSTTKFTRSFYGFVNCQVQ